MSKASSLRLRFSLFALVAAFATLAVGSSASAQITVGQISTDPETLSTCASANGYNEIQGAVVSGASYAAPTAGVLTSWSTTGRTPGLLALAVYRPLAGSVYKLVTADLPRAITPGSVNTFPIALPVQAGDVIGTVLPSGENAGCLFRTELPGDLILYKEGNAAVGSNLEFPSSEGGYRVNASATLLPPPTLASLSPAKGSVKGAKVTITGTNFASVTGVAFGGVPAKSFTVDNEGQITATAPASKKLAKVPVAVTTVAGTATSATTYAYEGCKVPNLAGKKLKASKKKASKADCKIGKVTKKDGATGKTGKVTKQNPKPGKVLAPGTKIKVTLEP